MSGEISEKILTYYPIFRAAQNMVASMEKLEGNTPETLIPYHMLGVYSLELFAKASMAMRLVKNGTGRIEISKSLRRAGHDLDRIYTSYNVGSVMGEAGITCVELVSDSDSETGFPKHFYVFTLEDGSKIPVYDSESLRYGALANKVNALVTVDGGTVLELCKKVQDAVIAEYKIVDPINTNSNGVS